MQSLAQTGVIKGEVYDLSTGNRLSDVVVTIEGTGNSVVTDIDGRYIHRRVPTGDQRLIFKNIGYIQKDTVVYVDSGENSVHHIALSGDYTEGDEVFSIAYQRENAKSLSKQRESINIRSVLSSELMDRFSDITIEDAMVRIPGVQVNRRGEVNIRGTGYNMYNVTVDGQRLGTTGMGSRSIDLSSFSTDMVQELDVIKVVTPDMDADALSGVVNIRTRQSVGNNQELGVRLGGGGNPRYFGQSGPNSRASLSFSDSPRDDLFYTINVGHHTDQRPWETLQLGYGVVDFGNGMEDVIESISPSLQLDENRRLGSNIQLTFQPSNQDTYHFQGMFNNVNRELIQHRNSWIAGGDWVSPEEAGSQGSFNYDVSRLDVLIRQYALQAGGKHMFSMFDLQYNIGWGHSTHEQEYFRYPFDREGLSYRVDMQDRTRPTMEITNIPLLPDGTINPSLVALQHIERTFDGHVDNTYSGNVDIELPFKLGSLKFGSSALLTYKEGDYNEYNYRHLRRFTLDKFNKVRHGQFDVLDQYHISRFVDPHSAHAFYTGNRPSLTLNEPLHRETSGIWNYNATEHIYSGYGMGLLQMGRVAFLAGLRMEHTDAGYEGRQVRFDDIGSYVSTTDTTQNNSYTHLFPNAQLNFTITEQTDIRLAYSNTISRPHFNQLAPFELTNVQNLTLFRGNPQLEPVTSDNLDLLIEHYTNTGAFSIGLFHKSLNNFTFQRERTIEVQEGDFQAFDALFNEEVSTVSVRERTFENGDESATIQGLELSWRQNLTFLPSFLGNFGTYANYTYSNSTFKTGREDDTQLPGQSPHVFNIALSYDQNRISTQIAYHRTAPTLYVLQESTQLAPSAHASDEIYMDLYEDGWSDLSLSIRFRLSNNFRIWFDALNLLDTESIQYAYDRDLYPISTDLRGGREFRLGIRYNL